jgi:hypothetical protein
MSSGAPLSRAVLEQVLDRLLRLVPGASLAYRSDRDGPIRQGTAQQVGNTPYLGASALDHSKGS